MEQLNRSSLRSVSKIEPDAYVQIPPASKNSPPDGCSTEIRLFILTKWNSRFNVSILLDPFVHIRNFWGDKRKIFMLGLAETFFKTSDLNVLLSLNLKLEMQKLNRKIFHYTLMYDILCYRVSSRLSVFRLC